MWMFVGMAVMSCHHDCAVIAPGYLREAIDLFDWLYDNKTAGQGSLEDSLSQMRRGHFGPTQNVTSIHLFLRRFSYTVHLSYPNAPLHNRHSPISGS